VDIVFGPSPLVYSLYYGKHKRQSQDKRVIAIGPFRCFQDAKDGPVAVPSGLS
jgi:hypothetical protein